MTYYWDDRFTKHLYDDINTIVEVGARYGDESLQLANKFKGATVYSFECNPLTVEICRQKLTGNKNIKFFDHGLGDTNEVRPFYSYIQDNDGASSFYKRIDFENTQKLTGTIQIRQLIDVVKENNIESIDLLCMDIQGYELNVLKGTGEFLPKINYVIMEEPAPIINRLYLPENTHSKYINAPTSQEIRTFMEVNGFELIERIKENEIEDNVMYKNTKKL
jgi:FkbM family methyltransferase